MIYNCREFDNIVTKNTHITIQFKCIYLNVICFETGFNEEDMKKTYICPSDFVRNGNSCYYFSTHMATWQEAHFACKDKDSELARMEKGWEDRNMRNYLNKPELGKSDDILHKLISQM
jgi:hypothetical protein